MVVALSVVVHGSSVCGAGGAGVDGRCTPPQYGSSGFLVETVGGTTEVLVPHGYPGYPGNPGYPWFPNGLVG